MLVIACPCALVIATPVTVVSGLAAAARKGILMKGGVYLEEARKIKVVALDKTGTVTEGKPRLLTVRIIPSVFSEDEVLSWAMGLADSSAHPVSKAIGIRIEPDGESGCPIFGFAGKRGERNA